MCRLEAKVHRERGVPSLNWNIGRCVEESGVCRRRSLVAATAQTLDCEQAMVIVEDCLKGSVLHFLMHTVMCCGLVMFGKKAMSSRVRCTLRSN